MKRVIWSVVIAAIAVLVVISLRPRPLPVELGKAEIRTVHEYIAEEAKTRLAKEYLVDAPVSGTVQRITWEVGDEVEAGEVLARIESFDLEQQIRGVESLIAQTRAQIVGVDTAKPKPEDISAAEMRVREMSDSLRIAEKENAIVEIDYAEAQKEYRRVQQLVAEGVASQSQLDEAERRYKGLEQNLARARLAAEAARKTLEIAGLNAKRIVASIDDNEYMREAYQAEIQRLESQLNILRSDLGKTVIRAPVSGPILEKYIDDRRVLPAGTPLLKMGDLETLEIESDVLSEEVVRVKPGDAVEIIGRALLLDSSGRQSSSSNASPVFSGTVKRIYPSAFKKISSLGIEQQRVKVLIDFDHTQARLRAGTRLDVRIITAVREQALAVPERSTFRREGQWYVFAVRDGRARLAPVTIGLKNDEWAEIQEGLSPGDIIVAEPMNDLEDGMRVVSKK